MPAGHYFMMGDNRDRSQDSRVLNAGRLRAGRQPDRQGRGALLLDQGQHAAVADLGMAGERSLGPDVPVRLSMSAKGRRHEKLEARLGYRFADPDLLDRALTHSSALSPGQPHRALLPAPRVPRRPRARPRRRRHALPPAAQGQRGRAQPLARDPGAQARPAPPSPASSTSAPSSTSARASAAPAAPRRRPSSPTPPKR